MSMPSSLPHANDDYIPAGLLADLNLGCARMRRYFVLSGFDE
jgi:hypothetical protein